MKKFNGILACILSMVTCGIYSMYLWYAISKNNNELAEKNNITVNNSFIVALLLGCITCGIYLYVWMYLCMKQQVELANAKGVKISPDSSPIILSILMFIPVYSFYVLCDNYNRTVDAYAEEV